MIFFSARCEYKNTSDKTYDVAWMLEQHTISTINQRGYVFSSVSERDQAVQLELGVLSVYHDLLYEERHGFKINILPPKNGCKF